MKSALSAHMHHLLRVRRLLDTSEHTGTNVIRLDCAAEQLQWLWYANLEAKLISVHSRTELLARIP